MFTKLYKTILCGYLDSNGEYHPHPTVCPCCESHDIYVDSEVNGSDGKVRDVVFMCNHCHESWGLCEPVEKAKIHYICRK